ncbi:MAG TPA: toll/interleukin-1 receptor domain-containing protein [Allosphingosinicella sp.]|nr:toll/interleukin-1 receptor domain-containing protein [Allosphingosinicella sp.]
MAEPARPEVRYTAFLSYSHKDAAAAGRLHRRLEAYRLPKRLAGTETARGIVPERLWPIFRDREELPAATDLSETVREALAQSGALIVLCSPHSAQSLWVAEEIETFRRLHPDRPVLAAILDGDPPDCFPAALRAFGKDGTWHEPLATDLRRGKDGAHLGLLKLVAGITGVGLDALVQRDAARRVRRITMLSALALAAMLIMAALAVFALDARRESERQRAEAEGLAEFLLTDLREGLKGVGRLDIMRPVNERALAYHNRQLLRYNRPADRIMRARVLHAIGEDEILRGNHGASLPILREAYRTTATLLEAMPADPGRLLDHARSEYWIGRVHELRRDWPVAQRHYERFANLAERLIASAPANPDYMRELASSQVDLGNLELGGIGDYAAAEHYYRKAVYWYGRALQIRPGDEAISRSLANANGWLADSFFMRGLWRQSLDARLHQHRIVERLYLADPANIENGYRLALAERGVGRSLAHVDDRSGARRHLFAAYDWSIRLSRRDPGNAEWLLFKAFVGCDLYYSELGLPPGVSRAHLAGEIRRDQRALRGQGNPRFAEFSNCVNALDGPPTP